MAPFHLLLWPQRTALCLPIVGAEEPSGIFERRRERLPEGPSSPASPCLGVRSHQGLVQTGIAGTLRRRWLN